MMKRSISRVLWFSVLNVIAVGMAGQLGHTQTFAPLHEFTGGADGADPFAGLTVDRAGNLYGTAAGGSSQSQCRGAAFKLTHTRSGWLFEPLYCFTGGDDGESPEARIVFGPDGALYGTTNNGGGSGCGGGGCGTVFELRPPASVCQAVSCPWTETVLYRFGGGTDGAQPEVGDLAFDSAGNIYGTTIRGGGSGCSGGGCGVVFELVRGAGGGWTEQLLYSFSGGNDGGFPVGVVFDSSGSLFGTTYVNGMYSCGTVFQLTNLGPTWEENTIYSFNPNIGDACNPYSGVAFDNSGNLYGTNYDGGYQGGGAVFQLAPDGGGGWSETVVYAFTSGLGMGGPEGEVTVDQHGRILGTTAGGGAYGFGAAFEITPSSGGWTYTSLHDFLGFGDGELPMGSVVTDTEGNFFGTASLGGEYGDGAVWEVTP